MKEYKTSKSCLTIIRIAIVASGALLIALCCFFLAFIPNIMYILNVLFFLATLFFAGIYCPIYFKNLKYFVADERKIIKVSGFFFKKRQIMMIDTIQYTTAVTTPFSRITGLNFFLLYAYGGIMTIMFLNKNDLEELSYMFRK